MGPAPELVGDLLVLGVALGRAPQHGQAHVHQEQALGALAARRAQQQVLRLHVAVHVPGGPILALLLSHTRAGSTWALIPHKRACAARGAAFSRMHNMPP